MSLDPAYQPGQLNAMFESIEERFKGIYDVQVTMLVTILVEMFVLSICLCTFRFP
jgi:hypothetical protein